MKKRKPLPEGTGEVQQESREVVSSEGGATRRAFLARFGLGATLLAIGGQVWAFLRSLVPNVLYEEPIQVKVGTPDQYGEGGQFLEDRGLFIFRESNTFYAISATCTHLGCTVRMERLSRPRKVRAGGREIEEHVEFQCPCHGSKYYGDGTNYSGPAPRPLAYFRMEISPDDGQLLVDTSTDVGRDFRLTV